ncbi:hypothetical protein D6D20_10270 [Aureobasidium pullulans]|uniref:Uncharacterized protein n=1 Tax=Aureobasidium pullulans TaxID=5580 RepID=A0A4S8YTA7_AURPU|nr:hypothetical protein D6D20_10270 [Aureobasidium pullulans]
MKLCTRSPTRFMPLLKVHQSSRRHATCTQIAPADHGQLDQVEVYQHQLSLVSPVDTLRYILLNDMRPLLHQMNMRAIVKEAVPPPNPAVSFPINGQMLDPNEFRRLMAIKGFTKFHRKLMKEQMLRCQNPQDIMRVVAVALQRKDTSLELAAMDLCLVRAFYRARETTTDHKIFGAINTVISRFRREGLPITRYFLAIGIKFAARSRSLPGMKRYLKLYRELGFVMPRNLFRAIIAKFSVGNNGYGEIRNGRWSRRDLLQVLLGFDDTPPGEEHHLGLFLDRSEWTQLHGWMVVLSRCKATDELWKEWLLWLANPIRSKSGRPESANAESKLRGDYRYIEAMAEAGDTARAWTMLRDSEISFKACRTNVRRLLLRDLEHATLWDDQIPLDLLEQYDAELTKIERALGVEWISMCEDQGYHKPTDFMQQSLEALSSPFFKLEPDYGFPYDGTPEEIKARHEQMMLHVEDMAMYMPKTARKTTMSEYDTMS